MEGLTLCALAPLLTVGCRCLLLDVRHGVAFGILSHYSQPEAVPMHLVLRAEAFSMLFPLPLLAVKLCHIGLEQEDFLPFLQQPTVSASTFPEVATDLSLGSGSECVSCPTPSILCFIWERDSEINGTPCLCATKVGYLKSCPTSVCLTSTWWRLTEIAGKWMWAPLVSKTPRYDSKWLC